MLILNGIYHVQPNKKLTILPEIKAQPKGTLESDITALRVACEISGRCDVQVMTQHGMMLGTLVERKPLQLRLWQFEGYLAFPAKA
ncbi:hypothetical protein [Deinococcus radiotolerans]|uniref:hypothetical protein n=1 Tax=Deinococcus radiotolerans TaxID=1309407 RepID=UPI00166D9B01|nr:hypothetical protein [Deinococcus radiotolerans]